MRVFQIQDDWGFDHLQPATRPDPKPRPGQVLLRMKAASLNYRDLLVPNRGYGSFTGTLPLIPISDGVGEVVAVGAGVTRVKIGDRVGPFFHQGWIAGEPDLARLTQTLGGPIATIDAHPARSPWILPAAGGSRRLNAGCADVSLRRYRLGWVRIGRCEPNRLRAGYVCGRTVAAATVLDFGSAEVSLRRDRLG